MAANPQVGGSWALAVLAIGFLPAVVAVVRWLSSRFIVTDRRIIIRVGLLSLTSYEMLLNKVESIQLDRSLVDRIWGSGTLVIVGSGGSRETFRRIAHAQRFREAATYSIEHHGGRRR